MNSEIKSVDEYVNFKIKYSGIGTKNGKMELDDLTNSLSGLSKSLKRIAYLINNTHISIKINGSPKSGSLDVCLSMLKEVLLSSDVAMILSAYEIIKMFNSFLNLIKKLKINKNNKGLGLNDDINNINNEEVIKIDNNMLLIFKDYNFRTAFNEFVSPLNKNISKIQIIMEEENIVNEIYPADIDGFVCFQNIIENVGVDYFKITKIDINNQNVVLNALINNNNDDEFQKNYFKENDYHLYKQHKIDFNMLIVDNVLLQNLKNGCIKIKKGSIIKAKYRKIITENGKNVKWEILKLLKIEQY